MKEQNVKETKAAKVEKQLKPVVKKTRNVKNVITAKKVKSPSKKTQTEDVLQKSEAFSDIDKKNVYLCIDYPVENENINGVYHYALRIGASNDGYVEISFNGGEWNPCRYGNGFWWFDIMSFKAGSYVLKARMSDNNGNTIIETQKRNFSIC